MANPPPFVKTTLSKSSAPLGSPEDEGEEEKDEDEDVEKGAGADPVTWGTVPGRL